MSNDSIRVEITGLSEFHCFRVVFRPRDLNGQEIKFMLHATQLVDLIHKGSVALCEWQHATTSYLLERTPMVIAAPDLLKAGKRMLRELSDDGITSETAHLLKAAIEKAEAKS